MDVGLSTEDETLGDVAGLRQSRMTTNPVPH